MKLLWIISDYEIGCFKTPSGLFSETLGDFTHEADPAQALMKCGELAHNKNYHVFALGSGGLCQSGDDAQHKYFLHRAPAKRTKCSNGIGLGPQSVVYSFGMDDVSLCFTSYTCACGFLAMVRKERYTFQTLTIIQAFWRLPLYVTVICDSRTFNIYSFYSGLK